MLRLEGRDKIGLYFTRYAEETKWRFALGAVEGQPGHAGLRAAPASMARPAHFVLIGWLGEPDHRDPGFPLAPYVLEAIDWVRLG